MKNFRNLWMSLLFMFAILLLAACGSAANIETAVAENDEHDTNSNTEQMDMDSEHVDEDGEHTASEETDGSSMEHEHAGAPDEFATLANPFSDDEAAIVAGREIFATNCVACHGEAGKGDGPAAASLDPKPANLSDGTMINMLSDGYLYWRVSKGGIIDPFNSAMPAWESALTEDQRWEVISYIRTLSTNDGMEMDGMNMNEDGEHMDEDGEHTADE